MWPMPNLDDSVQIFSTCPPSNVVGQRDYLRQVAEIAKWSEECGCTGILVYSDNSLIDPWMVSQIIVQNTIKLAPLVAIQPIYMHPYTAAKLVASFAYPYERGIYVH